MAIRALSIGVPDPEPFLYQGYRCSFRPAPGAANDSAWFAAFVRAQDPAAAVRHLSSPEETRRLEIVRAVVDMTRGARDGDTLMLFLAGHGFRVRDLDGDESDDVRDEVFAASDTGLLDDEFAEIWRSVDVDANIVVIADTCSADTQGIQGGEPAYVDHVVGEAPRKLGIAAALSWEEALELGSPGRGPRGVMCKALEDAWCDPDARLSYRTWFEAAALMVAVRSPQHPRLRSIGPDQRLLKSAPFA